MQEYDKARCFDIGEVFGHNCQEGENPKMKVNKMPNNIMKNRSMKLLLNILGTRYGHHLASAVRSIDITGQEIGDEDYDESVWQAYVELLVSSDRTEVCGISKPTILFLNEFMTSIHSVVLNKLLIPSMPLNAALRYNAGYQISRAMRECEDESILNEYTTLLKECSSAFSVSDFCSHIAEYARESMISGPIGARFILQEYHSTTNDAFARGVMDGISEYLSEEIETRRIVDLLDALEDDE